jgi:hypothetical protein
MSITIEVMKERGKEWQAIHGRKREEKLNTGQVNSGLVLNERAISPLV